MPDRRKFLTASESGRSVRDALFDAEEVLRGLSPRLVIDLARLAGATKDDLSVTLHLMPYGDRAVMAAYGLIEMSPAGEFGERGLTVDNACLEVIAAAAELVASVVDPAAVAARLQNRFEPGREPFVPVVAREEQSGNPTETVVGGVVRDVSPAGEGLVRLNVELDGPGPRRSGADDPESAETIVVVTQAESPIQDKGRVSLTYWVSEPLSIAAGE